MDSDSDPCEWYPEEDEEDTSRGPAVGRYSAEGGEEEEEEEEEEGEETAAPQAAGSGRTFMDEMPFVQHWDKRTGA